MAILAFDIGGANLKAVHSDGCVRFQPFALWKNPAGLADALRTLAQTLPPFDRLAVTMTGELCDCFASKRAGVAAILDAVDQLAQQRGVQVWQTTGVWADSELARTQPLQTAAANWHALATYAGRFAPLGSALIIDIGSTTTDMVPLWNGRPVPIGRTDFDRLRTRELVYTGVRRTPVCALLGEEGMAEWFATTHDVYLMLGLMPADAADGDTADGRPAIRSAAHARLARMLGADGEMLEENETLRVARQICARQVELLCGAAEVVSARLPERPRTLVMSGSGEFLCRMVLAACPLLQTAKCVSLEAELGSEVSRAACAHALAVLAAETCGAAT